MKTSRSWLGISSLYLRNEFWARDTKLENREHYAGLCVREPGGKFWKECDGPGAGRQKHDIGGPRKPREGSEQGEGLEYQESRKPHWMA